ncbi:uncharacterized protein LOC108597604 isoform X4 [Drosophila busckii]|uniref:uncharacterized protein LOC108597604 isoform X4 n=1 Tax=Drosophila busckii TaxID=30019 RepID=UPI00083EF1E7|nr:uncharacterized protein LOC108597604 isoform X4 [Drosophila busckii]
MAGEIFVPVFLLFFVFVIVFPIVYYLLQFLLWWCFKKCCGIERPSRNTEHDRQNTAELGRQHNNYADIFYIEPNSPEAARIREQLEKDDKELPSYDEVMRMCNLTSPTAAAAPTSALPAVAVTPMDSGPIGIAALPAPPYSELDPHTSPVGAPVAITISALETAPSTSRAAQTPT